MCLRRSDRYNGWANYETWAVVLWLDNEEGMYLHWRDLATEMRDQAKDHRKTFNTPKQEAEYQLAKRLKEEVGENDRPYIDNSVYSDLLGAALSEVNWHEVAAHFLED